MGSEAQGKRPHPQLRPTRSLPRTTSNPPAACQRHRAMRRGFGCNLILNHIRCRNRNTNQIERNPNLTNIETGSTMNLNNESETKKNEPEQLPLPPIKSPPAHREAASRQVTEQINRRRRRCRRYTAWSPRREGEGCCHRDVSERNGTRPLGYPAM